MVSFICIKFYMLKSCDFVVIIMNLNPYDRNYLRFVGGNSHRNKTRGVS